MYNNPRQPQPQPRETPATPTACRTCSSMAGGNAGGTWRASCRRHHLHMASAEVEEVVQQAAPWGGTASSQARARADQRHAAGI